jgi:FkbM family methyltransferase
VPFDKDFLGIKYFPDIENAVYLDVGGNRGFAIDAILMNKNKCRIYSFEPNHILAEKMKKRFKKNPRVEIYNWGLGNKEGEFTLYVPVYRGYEFSGLASFIKEHAKSWLKDNNLYFYNEKLLKISEHKCVIKKLDDLELDPFFIKLDVQGYEYQVLLGGKNMIKHAQPILLIESVKEGDEIMSFLCKFGYKLFRYENNKFIPDESGRPNSFLMTESKYNMIKATV